MCTNLNLKNTWYFDFMKQTFNRTKIIATLGPATGSPEMLERIIRAGTNVCRVNASHGHHHEHATLISHIREINKRLNIHTGIIVDLQGPKIRIGRVSDQYRILGEKQEVQFTTHNGEVADDELYISYQDFPKDVSAGDTILVDDGKIELMVTATDKLQKVTARVIHGGKLMPNKGVNLPFTKISLPCLTEKDLLDLEFALQHDADWIGLSFVRSAADVVYLKELIAKSGKHAKVIAKIEKPEAIKDIDRIIGVTDAIMVARGDLGVEMQMEQVPLIQKMLVKKCKQASKPIIIATQMMESMIENYSPTRAEVNDVGNAVLDGADAVMLSAETSVGKYPVKVVDSMKKIISVIESDEGIYHHPIAPDLSSATFLSDSVCYNATVMAQQSEAKAIIAMTHSGYTAFKISSHRPKAPTFIFTDNRPILTTLSLVWGVRGFYYDKYVSTDDTIEDIKKFLRENHFVATNDVVIHVSSIPIKYKGRSNMIKIYVAE
jgi:pyruvate kinase